MYEYLHFCKTTKSTCTSMIITLDLKTFESCDAASDFPSVRAVG